MLRVILVALLLALEVGAQQVPDLAFNPPIRTAAYDRDKGPVVAIDEAHSNSQTLGGQLRAFANLLRRDGYRVVSLAEPLSADALKTIDVLVLGNPGGWSGASASLRTSEITALIDWIRSGGSLLLILDHKPMPGTGAAVAHALGVNEWHDGFAMVERDGGLPAGLIIFRRQSSRAIDQDELPPVIPTYKGWATYRGRDAVLRDHAITNGRHESEYVRAVMTFVGSAFQLPPNAEPIMSLPTRAVSIAPEAGMEPRDPQAPRIAVAGWVQGAVMRMGRGRVALFGEAAMFSAQLSGPDEDAFGMNHPAAAHNYRLVLNVLHWLTGIL